MVVVNGKDDIPYMENKSHVWNHQPGNYIIQYEVPLTHTKSLLLMV